VPHLSSPYFAYFDHEASTDGEINMYIGTRGRGVWRVSFDQPPIADAGGPYTTNEGTTVQLDGSNLYDPSPGGSIVSYEWDFDDGGTDSDSTDVVIVGNAQLIRSAGYWYHQYRGNGRIAFTAAQLQCYLDIVKHLSSLFSEAVDADSRADAKAVLDPSHSTGDTRVQLDRQLLALWLIFANGAIEYDTLVDTNFDTVPDAALLDVLCAAEAARLNPATPTSVLRNWKNIVEAVNLSDDS